MCSLSGITVGKGSRSGFNKEGAATWSLDLLGGAVGGGSGCACCVAVLVHAAVYDVLHKAWEDGRTTVSGFFVLFMYRFKSLGRRRSLLFWSLWRIVREKQRRSGVCAAFLLSSMQLWLLANDLLWIRPFIELKPRFGRLGWTWGKHLGLLWDEDLLDWMEARGRGRTGYSGDGRWLDSKPDEDLLMVERVFLPLPEINKWSVRRSYSCQAVVTCIWVKHNSSRAGSLGKCLLWNDTKEKKVKTSS